MWMHCLCNQYHILNQTVTFTFDLLNLTRSSLWAIEIPVTFIKIVHGIHEITW